MNIVQVSDKILDTINTFMEYLMGILFLSLVVITFQEVLRRYLLNDPTHWASEASRFLLIWMTFTGACIVTRLVAHLTMGFTIHRFVNKSISRFIKVFISAIAAVSMIVLTYYSGKVTLLAGYRPAPMTGIHMYYVWSALPFNGAIMSLYMIAETVKHIFDKEEEVSP
ncbi:MAG: TRAP transporter small permease [Desulfobacula sp.]|jgi:TRAP-type C4-dicarboxylate transport system permease small subunit|nr:TRAP transporter small permease [Desulfobacula sp.]